MQLVWRWGWKRDDENVNVNENARQMMRPQAGDDAVGGSVELVNELLE